MQKIIYDRIAERYDQDWSGIYASARAHCIKQISRQLTATTRPIDAVDLGIGTGNAFYDLRRHIDLGNCTGFDVSRGMLNQASSKLDRTVRLIQSNALSAPRHISPASQDLVLCHFMLSFIDAGDLLEVAHGLLRPGGLLSLATTTRRSLRELYNGRFSRAGRLLGVQRSLRKLSNPTDHRHCQRMVAARGFEVAAERLHHQPVCFSCYEDVRGWAVDSGWIATAHDDRIGLRIAGGRALFKLGEIFMHPLYPIDAVSEVSILLAQKPVNGAADFNAASQVKSGFNHDSSSVEIRTETEAYN